MEPEQPRRAACPGTPPWKTTTARTPAWARDGARWGSTNHCAACRWAGARTGDPTREEAKGVFRHPMRSFQPEPSL